MTPQAFAALVKEKYPDYADQDDVKLTRRILQKYPDYRSRVNLPSAFDRTPNVLIPDIAAQHGLRISSGKRTRAEQDALIAQGRTKAYNSRHLTGNAFDIALPREGVRDPKKLDEIYDYLADNYGGELDELIHEGDHVHVAWRNGLGQAVKEPSKGVFASANPNAPSPRAFGGSSVTPVPTKATRTAPDTARIAAFQQRIGALDNEVAQIADTRKRLIANNYPTEQFDAVAFDKAKERAELQAEIAKLQRGAGTKVTDLRTKLVEKEAARNRVQTEAAKTGNESLYRQANQLNAQAQLLKQGIVREEAGGITHPRLVSTASKDVKAKPLPTTWEQIQGGAGAGTAQAFASLDDIIANVMNAAVPSSGDTKKVAGGSVLDPNESASWRERGDQYRKLAAISNERAGNTLTSNIASAVANAAVTYPLFRGAGFVGRTGSAFFAAPALAGEAAAMGAYGALEHAHEDNSEIAKAAALNSVLPVAGGVLQRFTLPTRVAGGFASGFVPSVAVDALHKGSLADVDMNAALAQGLVGGAMEVAGGRRATDDTASPSRLGKAFDELTARRGSEPTIEQDEATLREALGGAAKETMSRQFNSDTELHRKLNSLSQDEHAAYQEAMRNDPQMKAAIEQFVASPQGDKVAYEARNQAEVSFANRYFTGKETTAPAIPSYGIDDYGIPEGGGELSPEAANAKPTVNHLDENRKAYGLSAREEVPNDTSGTTPVETKPVDTPSNRAKEPWQMTRDEFGNSYYQRGTTSGTYAGSQAERASTDYEGSFAQKYGQGGETHLYRNSDIDGKVHVPLSQNPAYIHVPEGVEPAVKIKGGVDPHRYLVEQAIAEGKPVPPEVLAEYSDLSPSRKSSLRLTRDTSDGNTHTFTLMDGDTSVGTMRVTDNGSSIRVDNIEETGKTKNKLGTRAILKVRDDLLAQFPDATSIEGNRISGAREAAAARRQERGELANKPFYMTGETTVPTRSAEKAAEPESVSLEDWQANERLRRDELARRNAEQPVHELSYEEARDAYARAKEDEKNLLTNLFGEEDAQRYEALHRRANSSTRSQSEVDAAAAELEAMEARLAPEQQNKLYGIDMLDIENPDVLRDYVDAMGSVSGRTVDELAESVHRAITQVGNETDPIHMNEKERLAYVKLREAFRLAKEQGLDTKAVSERAIQMAAERFGFSKGETADVEFMLGRYLKPEVTAVEPEFVARSRKRLQQGIAGNTLSANPVQALYDAAVTTGYDIYKGLEAGARTFSAWSKQMMERFGDEVRPHLTKIWAGLGGQAKVGEDGGRSEMRVEGDNGDLKPRSLPETLEQHHLLGGNDRFYKEQTHVETRQLAIENADNLIAEHGGLEGAAGWIRANEQVSAEGAATAWEVIDRLQERAVEQLDSDPAASDRTMKLAEDLAGEMSARFTRYGQTVDAARTMEMLHPARVKEAAQKILDKTKPGERLSDETGKELVSAARDIQATKRRIRQAKEQQAKDVAAGGGKEAERLRTRIADLERRIAERDFSKVEKNKRSVTEEVQALRDQRDVLREQLRQLELGDPRWTDMIARDERRLVEQRAKLADQLDDLNRWGKIRRGITSGLSGFRAIKTSWDLSAPGRQGWLFSVTHPWEGLVKPFGKQLIAVTKVPNADSRIGRAQIALGLEDFKAMETRLASNPNAEEFRRFGGEWSSSGADAAMGSREEPFQSNWADKVPGVARSEQAYSAFLNNQRLNMYETYKRWLTRFGITPENRPEVYAGIARYISDGTGRGTLAGASDLSRTIQPEDFKRLRREIVEGRRDSKVRQAEDFLQNMGVPFAYRWMKSRFNLLNPAYYAKLPTPVRLIAAKEAIQFVSTIGLTMYLAKQMGAAVEDDPEAPDFGLVRFGNTRYDLTGGEQNAVRFLARMSQAAYEQDSQLGSWKKGFRGWTDEGGKHHVGAAEILQDYARSKLSPAYGVAVDKLTGERLERDPATGKRLPFSYRGVATDLVAPLMAKDFADAYRQEGMQGVAKTVPSLFGISVQNYKARDGAARKARPTEEQRAAKSWQRKERPAVRP